MWNEGRGGSNGQSTLQVLQFPALPLNTHQRGNTKGIRSFSRSGTGLMASFSLRQSYTQQDRGHMPLPCNGMQGVSLFS